jgi:seryl-tRNA synthetase
MLDIRFIRDNAGQVKAAAAAKKAPVDVEALLDMDRDRRRIIQEVEQLKASRNQASRDVARLKAQDGPEREGKLGLSAALITREIGDKIRKLDGELRTIEEKLEQALLAVPNVADPSVPEGNDETGNVVDRTIGDENVFDFTPRPHWELGEKLGIIDFERGVKVSGTRFYMLRGAGARLQRALIAWMLDVHTRERGYSEVYPPYIVTGKCLVGTGQLPKFADNLYHDAEEDLWLIPTAEVPVTNMYRDEVLEANDLTLKHVAYTPCFRREKMSAGKDTRGIKRGHQFDKVELVKFCLPEKSNEELEILVEDACSIPRKLGLRYRVVRLCTGDLTFASMKTYDVEVWSPGCKEWLEVSSCSNFGDFQARRANIRFRRDPKARPEYLHTLNGSGLALPRTLIAVLENYQNPDGTVAVPEALRPYLGMDVIR